MPEALLRQMATTTPSREAGHLGASLAEKPEKPIEVSQNRDGEAVTAKFAA